VPATRLRPARDADVPEIVAVVDAAFAAFVARTGIRPAPLATDWPTTISALGALVATRDDRVVGVLVLWPHPDHVLVEVLAVRPEEHGTGLGSLLLDRAELTAIESGTNAVRLATNAAMTEARDFYARRGFAERGRWPEQGYDRVHLEKRLA
jgi:GNAT superfamily N-acetyltransferase